MARMSQLALLEDLNDSGGRIDGELTHTGFSHPHLQRGHPELLHKIKREPLSSRLGYAYLCRHSRSHSPIRSEKGQ
jgi:hypothetical protein